MKKPRLALLPALLIAALLWPSLSNADSGQAHAVAPEVENKLEPAGFNAVNIGGYVGEKIDLCIENRLMAQDIGRIIQPYKDRPDEDWGFRSEFWGKWFTGAMFGYGYQPTAEHRAVIDRGVREILATQDENGYIGTYLDENHLGEWDVWGRKYVLLGLLAYYDQTGDGAALDAAVKLADHLIMEAGPESGVNVAATGWPGYKGIAPSSVLEPIALLYQRTGDKRYLEFAEHIIRCWDSPNSLTPTGIRLVQEALDGKPMWKMGGIPKAYEMMSCFEGLCEMYRITGKQIYFDACRKLVDSILRDEIMIVGSGSCREIWCHGKIRQTEPLYQGMETCVTVTWMKLLYQMLRLTGESRYADQLEISLYNAHLGAMAPHGEWWAYYTGLMGERVHSHIQYGDVLMSCCVANGPRGLLTLPLWASMTSGRGIAVNFYGDTVSKLETPAGQNLTMTMHSSYPQGGTVKIRLGLADAESFDIDLRIPSWSVDSSVRINDEVFDGCVLKGTYATLRRTWKDGDEIVLDLDMRGRVVDAPSGVGDAAIMRGPIVLAVDTRLIPRRDRVDPPMYRYEFIRDADGYIELSPTGNSGVDAIWMTYDVPVCDEAGNPHSIPMCDYASAGNTWQEGNLFRVWIQQPFDFRQLYTSNLDWHANVTAGKQRPSVPDIYQVK